MNKTLLVGRITKKLAIETTSSGKNFTRFFLAINRRFKNAQGEREADFVPCIAWDKTAEVLKQYASKGSLISVEGEIRTNNYTDKVGNKRFSVEILVISVELLQTRTQSNSGIAQSQSNASSYTPQTQETAPAKTQGTNQYQDKDSDPFAGSDEIEIAPEDLPF
jgi:single-strand DNA-binding protein